MTPIIIGARFRKDLGDIDGLAASISDVGLLQPICVDTDGNLIDGVRRLKAWEQLGRPQETIARFAINLQDILKGEFAANTERKDFLPSEAVAIKRALEPLEQEAAKERHAASIRRTEDGQFTVSAESAQPIRPQKGSSRSRDKVAAVVGIGHTKLYEAEEVVKKAEDDPEKYGEIAEEMDRSGNVHKAYLQVITPELTSSMDTGTIVLAVPNSGITTAMQQDIAQANDVHIYLWVNNRNLPEAMRFFEETGVTYRACLTWCMRGTFHGKQSKDFVDDVRFAVLGTKGNATELDSPGQTWHFDDREDFKGKNKPQSFYDVVKTLSPEIIFNQE